MAGRLQLHHLSRLSTPDRGFQFSEFETHSRLATLIASGGGISRADLARTTGLARSTISLLTQPLLDAGILSEHGAGQRARGRPSTLLEANPQAGLILAADVGARHALLVVADLAQRRIAEQRCELDVRDGPEPILTSLVAAFNAMLKARKLPLSRVQSVVVGVPSPVDFERGICVRPPLMPGGWDGFPLAAFLQARLHAPVLVDNDVNLMALGEARNRPAQRSPLLFAKVSTGIGCGIVMSDGYLHRGADGAAGDIGHIRVAGHDEVVCHCGNIGCIEAVASMQAVMRTLSAARGRPIRDAGELGRCLSEGDSEAQRLIRGAAREIGALIAMQVHAFNPASVVLGGSMARLSDELLAGVRAVVFQRALPLATRSLVIENSVLGEYAGVEGAVLLGIEHALSPAGITRLMNCGPP
jgi:predicted NBD/HSP70 family sugar kinase